MRNLLCSLTHIRVYKIILRKFVSLLTTTVLLANSYLPYFAYGLQPSIAHADAPPALSVSFDTSKNAFEISVNTASEVEYVFAYTRVKDDGYQVEGLEGKGEDVSGIYKKKLYAGTCSATDCIDHEVKRAMVKVQVKDLSWAYEHRYILEANKEISLVMEGKIERKNDEANLLALTEENTKWLEDVKTLQPSLTPTPTYALPTSTPTEIPTPTEVVVTPPIEVKQVVTEPPTPTPTVVEPERTETVKVTIEKSETKVEPSFIESVLSTLLPFLFTDKPDYAPTEKAVISGREFLPYSTYTITISSSDKPPVSFSDTVTTTGTGTFEYTYQLDGTYRPNYAVEVKDGNGVLVAETSFTDGPIYICPFDCQAYNAAGSGGGNCVGAPSNGCDPEDIGSRICTGNISGCIAYNGPIVQCHTATGWSQGYCWEELHSSCSGAWADGSCPPPPDTDGDGRPDISDNCPAISNPDQTDSDYDGIGNACDPDDDDDTVLDQADNCPVDYNFDQINTDGDGFGDVCDMDDDNDGVFDDSDLALLNPQVCQDTDADSCDDCSQNPTSASSFITPAGWPLYSPAVLNDGPDSDQDSMCDIGDLQICGNYVIEPPEQCDDGNVVDSDGCSSLCQNEGPELLVINEIDYDQPNTDFAEFIEIKNIGLGPVNLDTYELRLINGNVSPPASYSTIDLPNGLLSAGDYFVVCGINVNVPNCDLVVTPSSNLIQNGLPGGAPDAIALYSGSGSLVDTVSYEGAVPGFTEGSVGAIADEPLSIGLSQGLSRYPDGQDTNDNSTDFVLSCSTPGNMNVNYPDCANPPTNTPTPTPIEAPIISQETSADPTENTISITWTTDHPATSRVIYDIVPHASLSTPPNYGYMYSTVEDPFLTTVHSVIVTGLNPATPYYLRAVSHGSPETVSNEITDSTSPITTPTPVVTIDPATTKIIQGEACGVGSAWSDDGLKVNITEWHAGYKLMGRYFIAGGSFGSWFDLSPWGTMTVSGTDASFFASNTGNSPPGLAGWAVKVVDASDADISNIDSLSYTINANQSSLVCGGVTVQLCKVDEQQSPLAGWNLMLSGREQVGTDLMLDTHDPAGVTIPSLTSGEYYQVEVSGTWNNGNIESRDTLYGSTGNLDPVNTGVYDPRIVKVVLDDTPTTLIGFPSMWGPYDSATHTYSTIYQTLSTSLNVRLWDFPVGSTDTGWYGDNSGMLTVRIFKLTNQKSVMTDTTGCGTLQGTIGGPYYFSEVPQSGWQYVSGAGDVTVSDNTTTFTIVNKPITITQEVGRVAFMKTVDQGPGQPQDWSFAVYDGNGGLLGDTFTSGQTYPIETGTYIVQESNVEGYSFDNVSGICAYNPNSAKIEMNVTSNGGTCTFENTRDTGSVKVNKRIDINGDGDWNDTNEGNNQTNANNYANSHGFGWMLDGGGQTYGTTVNNLATTLSNYYHNFEEYMPYGYHFVSWFNPAEQGRSCTNPNGTTMPDRVDVVKGQTTQVTLCNARDTGTVTIVKNAINNGEQNFGFHTNLPRISGDTFELEDDGNNNNGGTEESITVNVPTGTYYVSEDGESGWRLTDLNCVSDAQWGVRADGKSVTLDVVKDGAITCTFTNTKLAKLWGYKYHDKNNNGNWNPLQLELGLGNWRIFLDEGNGVYDGTEPSTLTNNALLYIPVWTGYYEFTGLLPGAYSVCEQLQSGWTNTTPVCQTVNLTPGDVDHFVDFGNIRYASISVDKITQPSGDLQKFNMYIKKDDISVDEFQLADADPVHVNNTLVPGTYSLTEAVPNGWMNDSWACTVNGQPVASNLSITIGGGEIAICSFTNSKLGSIEGHKFIDQNGNTNQEVGEPMLTYADIPGGVQIFLDGNSNGAYDSGEQTVNTDDTGYYKLDQLVASTYFVCEVVPTGWTASFPSNVPSYPNCQQINIAVGETVAHDFGNIHKGTVVVYKFHDLNANGKKDDGEPTLADWEITMSKDTTTIPSQTTDVNGSTTFNVNPGEYLLGENMQEGWYQSNIYCETEDPGEGVQITAQGEAYGHHGQCSGWNGCGNAETCALWACEVNGYSNLVSYGDQRPCTQFNNCNLFNSRGSVQMNWGNWCNVMGVTDIVCNNGSSVTPTPFLTPTPTVGDDQVGLIERILGVSSVFAQVDDNNDSPQSGFTVMVEPGERKTCYIGNYQKATITVNKNVINHVNQDIADDRSFDVYAGESLGTNAFSENSPYVFTVNPGAYTIQETNIDSRYLLDSTTGDEDEGTPNVQVTVNSGSSKSVTFVNKKVEPLLQISKFNNKWPTPQAVGAEVLYTITVDVLGNDMADVKVVDLPPAGFTYKSGSWTASKNGVPYSIPQPVYSSPGTWFLGSLAKGDVITLTYIATIGGDNKPGVYKDLAWAYGCAESTTCSILNADMILASSEDSTKTDPGVITDTVVGTQIEVPKVGTPNNTINILEKREGSVLGASTSRRLPATGLSNSLTIFALFQLMLGAIFGLFYFLRKRMKKVLKIGLSIMIVGSLVLLTQPHIFAIDAGEVVVRVEQPKSPTNEGFDLGFVALDIMGRQLTVRCYVSSPKNSWTFTQFGSDITLKAGGNSGICKVNTGDLAEGDNVYEVRITVLGEPSTPYVKQAEGITVKYVPNSSRPGVPTNYNRQDVSNCEKKISFLSANDGGKTVRVEVYRGDSTQFTLNDGSKVGTFNIGSNTPGAHVETVPDCNKKYYYALRAFDAAGNYSDVTGDRVYETVTTTTSGGTTETVEGSSNTGGAINVLDSDIPAERGSGQVLGEGTDNLSGTPEATPEGNVLGEEVSPTKATNLINAVKETVTSRGAWIVVGSVLILFGILYFVYRKWTGKDIK